MRIRDKRACGLLDYLRKFNYLFISIFTLVGPTVLFSNSLKERGSDLGDRLQKIIFLSAVSAVKTKVSWPLVYVAFK
jgi:hypothetical protein